MTIPIVGCTDVESIKKELTETKEKIKSLETSNTYLANELDALRVEVSSNDFKKATFTPDNTGFSRLDSSISSFLVSLKKAIPYADGYKLHINLGNPNYASFQDPVLTITWSKRHDYKKHNFDEVEKSKRTKKVSLLKMVRAGSWNSTEVIIAPATPEEIGEITLEIDTPTAHLNL